MGYSLNPNRWPSVTIGSKRRHMKRIFIFIALCATWTVQTQAQTPEPFKYRIKLTIEGKPDEDYRSRLESALNRELRNLGDAVVVESDPWWELIVIPLKLKNQGGYSPGYALSWVFIKHFNLTESHQVAKRLMYDQVQTAKFQAAGVSINDFYSLITFTGIPPDIPYFLGGGLYSGAEIETLCRDVIAEFDADILVPARKDRQWLKDIADKTAEVSKKK
jgi:hypothetical protein